jgi:putative salt-induced outer membrane protein YdiY
MTTITQQFKFSALGLLVATFSPIVFAATTPAKSWTTAAELGAITTSGNTKGTSVTGKIDSKQELTHWSNEYVLSAYFKEDEQTDNNGIKRSEKSAERYFVSGKGGYKLDQDNATLFVFGSYTDDAFGAYTKYSLVSLGYGDRLYQDDTKTLDAEVGPGYFSGRTSDNRTENGLMLRSAASLNWAFSDTAAFKQTLSVEAGSDNTRTAAESSISAKLNGKMQMKAAFLIQNDSDVPVGKKKTDTQTSLTLVYAF